jgi:hypothetical protein
VELSNRERVGRGLELLARGIAPFVDDQMKRFQSGKDWLQVMIERSQRDNRSFRFTRSDARLLLRVIEENPRAYVASLSRLDLAYVREVREVANRWAHLEEFDHGSTRRALDTITLLLRAIGAMSEAEQIDDLLDDLRRDLHQTSIADVSEGPPDGVIRPSPLTRSDVAVSHSSELNARSLVEFRNRDADYLAWVEANADAYVLNTGAQGGGNPRLHRAAAR